MWKNASYMQKVIMNTDYWEFNSIPEEDVHSVMEQAKVGDLNRAIKRLKELINGNGKNHGVETTD